MFSLRERLERLIKGAASFLRWLCRGETLGESAQGSAVAGSNSNVAFLHWLVTSDPLGACDGDDALKAPRKGTKLVRWLVEPEVLEQFDSGVAPETPRKGTKLVRWLVEPDVLEPGEAGENPVGTTWKVRPVKWLLEPDSLGVLENDQGGESAVKRDSPSLFQWFFSKEDLPDEWTSLPSRQRHQAFLRRLIEVESLGHPEESTSSTPRPSLIEWLFSTEKLDNSSEMKP